MLRESHRLEQKRQAPACAICGEGGEPGGWFLLTENRWLDRVKILLWNEALAAQAGVVPVCGAEHVQELVAHWMATGTLNHPFARVPGKPTPGVRGMAPGPDADTRIGTVVGELAVHRESLMRALSENPHALSGMLEALAGALGKKAPRRVECVAEVEALAAC